MKRHRQRRLVGARFAKGRFAKGQCRRCGQVFDYRDFAEEWDTGVFVCRDCRDAPKPGPVGAADAVALKHPQPLLDTEGVEPVTQLTELPQFWTTFGKYIPLEDNSDDG